METFTFAYHTPEVVYPDSGTKLSFGRGYEFASKPKGPDQVKYILHFDAMFFFENPPGTLSLVTRPTMNMAVLEAFYNTHKMYEKFIYPHPTNGNIVCRFDEPLKYKVATNGRGRVEPFSLTLLSQP